MTVVFVSAGIYHHISEITDALYERYGSDFHFYAIADEVPESIRIMGHCDDLTQRDYYKNIHESSLYMKEAVYWCENADVGIIGCGHCEKYLDMRMKKNRLTFKIKERPFKKRISDNPQYYEEIISRYYKPYIDSKLYYLCVGHYCASDLLSISIRREHLIKWGYFVYHDDDFVHGKSWHEPIRLLWVGRFIEEKRPQVALDILQYLVENGVCATLTYIGYGEMASKLQQTAELYNLSKQVSFMGSMPEWIVRNEMKNHDYFLFTSSFWEGWGVVLSEAMEEGMICFASAEAGSSCELIQHNKNGFIFHDTNEAKQLCFAIAQGGFEKWGAISNQAHEDMQKHWDAKLATNRLMRVMETLHHDKKLELFSDGVCSEAEIWEDA